MHLKRSQAHWINFKTKYLDPLDEAEDDEELIKNGIVIEIKKDDKC